MAVRHPLQVDEGYSLQLAALPLAKGLHAVAVLDIHPPLFLAIVHALVALHVPAIGIRLSMSGAGVASVAMLYWIVRRWHGEVAGLIGSAAAALMPSFIFYDPMIRMYALFDAFAIASFLILSVLYTAENLPVARRRVLWCAWSLACAAMIWTLYLGFIVIAAQLLYAAIVRRDGLGRSIAGGAAALLLWVPQWPTFWQQLPRGGLAFPFYASHPVQVLLELFGQSTIGVQTLGMSAAVIAVSAFAWVWVTSVLAIALPGNGKSLCVWMAVPAALTLAYGLVSHKLLYTDRYYLLFTYALCALTGVAVTRLAQRRPVAATAFGTAILACIAIAGSLYVFDQRLWTADWNAVGTLLHESSRDGDIIVFEQGSPFFVLERGDALDHRPLYLVFRRSDVVPAARIVRPFRRVWLVVFQAGPVDPNFDIYRGFTQTYRVAATWEYPRWLSAESASVVLFDRAR